MAKLYELYGELIKYIVSYFQFVLGSNSKDLFLYLCTTILSCGIVSHQSGI